MLKRAAILLFFVNAVSVLFGYVKHAQTQISKSIKNGMQTKPPISAFAGVNYWYGGFACVDSINGLQRVQKELDFLKQNGISTLRVMCSAEGDSTYPYRVYPSIQEQQGQLNHRILRGFDRFLYEVEKRNMKVVFVLCNNWEWSGGFGQYLCWSQPQIKHPPLPKTANWDWDNYCSFIGSFYSDTTATKAYWDFVSALLKHKSYINGKTYTQQSAIFAWQLANEPRPMVKEKTADFVKWVEKSAALIRKLDTLHYISIGVEGNIGLNQDMDLFKRIHNNANIDYATIHLWPKTWNWYSGNASNAFKPECIDNIKTYIDKHAQACAEIGKPLVIEEFGFERDANYAFPIESKEHLISRFSPNSKTTARDSFYALVYSEGLKHKVRGFHFWGYAGLPENVNKTKYFMLPGMAYSADPPQEEQGLYSVFTSDKTTWKVIRKYAKRMK